MNLAKLSKSMCVWVVRLCKIVGCFFCFKFAKLCVSMWKILYSKYNRALNIKPENEKTFFLQSMHLAWQVLLISLTTSFCHNYNKEREATFDRNMRGEEYNVADTGMRCIRPDRYYDGSGEEIFYW